MVGCVIPPLVQILNTAVIAKQGVEGYTAEQAAARRTVLNGLLATMSEPSLVMVNSLGGGSTNKTAKLTSIAKLMFPIAFRDLKKMEGNIDTVSSALLTCMELIMIKTCSNEQGDIVWSKFQGEVVAEVKRRAHAEGDAPM